MIEVRFYATLRIGRDKIYHVSPQELRTVAELLAYFRMATDEAATFLINGMQATWEDSIKDGDVVAIFPPGSGQEL